MPNPYIETIERHPGYGRYDAKVPDILRQATLDPDERPISAVKVGHGQGHIGLLILTSQRIRWIEKFPRRTHDHWPLEFGVVLHRAFPPVLLIPPSGDLFQGRDLFSSSYKLFVALSQLMAESIRWEAEHAAVEPVPVIIQGASGSLTDELERLAQQVEHGLLTPDEFTAAKQRLLST
jgi:hypothetical protein